jgi:hypothetical protein
MLVWFCFSLFLCFLLPWIDVYIIYNIVYSSIYNVTKKKEREMIILRVLCYLIVNEYRELYDMNEGYVKG